MDPPSPTADWEGCVMNLASLQKKLHWKEVQPASSHFSICGPCGKPLATIPSYPIPATSALPSKPKAIWKASECAQRKAQWQYLSPVQRKPSKRKPRLAVSPTMLIGQQPLHPIIAILVKLGCRVRGRCRWSKGQKKASPPSSQRKKHWNFHWVCSGPLRMIGHCQEHQSA